MTADRTETTHRRDGPVAFSPDALREYEEILGHYPQPRAALMPVLWLAQREFGWVGSDVQEYVAKLMGLPRAWVEGVVSFYTMYHTRPMGRHHLQLCTNLSCRLRGADEILSVLRRRLDVEPGKTTADGAFSLDCVECLGSCGTAPVIQLGSGPYFENLDVGTALALVDRLTSARAAGE